MIVPIGDKVLVEIEKAEEMTKGGIILPDLVQEEKTVGTILAVGNGRVLENGTIQPVRLEVGSRVIFGKFAGEEVIHEGKKYRVVKELEILAVIK